MAEDLKVSIKLDADTTEARTNVSRFESQFAAMLKALGKSPDEIRAFDRLLAELRAGKKATAELDEETRQLVDQYGALRRIAQDKDLLGLVPHQEINANIRKVEQAFERLKNSGKLSQAELAQAAVRTNQQILSLKRQTNGWADALSEARGQLAGLAGAGAGLGFLIKEAIDYESAMADVKKVVSGTAEQYDALSDKLKDLSQELPVSAEGLAQIAAAGGQLGVPIEKLGEFIELAAKMSVAFDMSAEQAGQAIAKLSNVFNLPVAAVEGLGDAINALGANTAASEAQIIESLVRIGGQSKQFGLAADQAAALSAAFIALGKTPEVAATGINALLGKLSTATIQGKAFQTGLEQLGVSAEQMAADIAADPQRALSAFLETLQQLDKQTQGEVIGRMFGLEYADDISLLVGSLEQYGAALSLVGDKGRTAGAMSREFATRMQTTKTQLELLRNALQEIAINLGSTFLPAVTNAAGAVRGVAAAVAEFVETFPLVAQLGTTLATVALSVGGLKTAFLALKLAGVGSAAEVAVALRSMAAPIATARKELGLLKLSFRGLGAAIAGGLVGWDIGKELSARFEVVRKAGVALTAGLVKGAEQVRYAWEVAMAVFTDDTVDAATTRHEQRLHLMEQTFDELWAAAAEGADAAAKAAETAAEATKKAGDAARAAVPGFQRLGAEAQQLEDFMAGFADTTAVDTMATALETLGLDLAEVTTGVSQTARTAIEAFAQLGEGVGAVGRSGADAAKILAAAFSAALAKIKTPQELALLRQALERSGLSGAALADALDAVGRKAKSLEPPVAGAAYTVGQLGAHARETRDDLAGLATELDNVKQSSEALESARKGSTGVAATTAELVDLQERIAALGPEAEAAFRRVTRAMSRGGMVSQAAHTGAAASVLYQYSQPAPTTAAPTATPAPPSKTVRVEFGGPGGPAGLFDEDDSARLLQVLERAGARGRVS